MKFHFSTLKSLKQERVMPERGTRPGEIHVWKHTIHYDDPFLRLAPFMLSQDELLRAARYHFEKDRRVYEAAHVFIRKVLAHYVSIEPEKLELSVILNNKPKLLNAPFPLHFNISHAGSKVMIAVGFDSDVGIDLEKVIPDFDTDGFAEANYHPNELAALQKLEGDDESFYFYTVWTRKEAWLKLTGEGVNDKLRELDFSGNNIHPKVSAHGHQNVYLTSWKDGGDYIISLASDFSNTHLKCFSSSLLLGEMSEDYNQAIEFGED